MYYVILYYIILHYLHFYYSIYIIWYCFLYSPANLCLTRKWIGGSSCLLNLPGSCWIKLCCHDTKVSSMTAQFYWIKRSRRCLGSLEYRLSTGTLLKELWKRMWAHECCFQTSRPWPWQEIALAFARCCAGISPLWGLSGSIFFPGTWSSLRWVWLQDGILNAHLTITITTWSFDGRWFRAHISQKGTS